MVFLAVITCLSWITQESPSFDDNLDDGEFLKKTGRGRTRSLNLIDDTKDNLFTVDYSVKISSSES